MDIFYNAEGNFIPPFSMTSAVFAPDDGVEFFREHDGRERIVFPARLEWFLGTGRRTPWPGWHRVENFNPMRCLQEFILIESPEQAMHFANRYGPLWACAGHKWPCRWRGDDFGGHGWANAERLELWLFSACQMSATLEAARRLREGEHVSREGWEAMGWGPPGEPLALAEEGSRVATVVAFMLESLHCHFGLTRQLEPELHAGLGFLGSLWQQTVAVIGGGHSIAICSDCGRLYIRANRAAKRGQRNYCGECAAGSGRQRLWRRSEQRREKAKEGKGT